MASVAAPGPKASAVPEPATGGEFSTVWPPASVPEPGSKSAVPAYSAVMS